jgi:histone acetyltransferase (RNA polymerase elongator complex component)
MNGGCPHRCVFCNEKLTAGVHAGRIEERVFRQTIRLHLGSNRRKSGSVQIAFYGGTFTGMDQDEQIRLLKLAEPFLRTGEVESIRISTRPDEIDLKSLLLLKTFGVSTIEIGAQSLDDEVLHHSKRGHTADDAVRAVSLIKAMNLLAGIHLMPGLPGDSPARFAETVEKTIALGPDMVRIHPTVVLKDTPLAGDFHDGRYMPLTLPDAISQCNHALKRLVAGGIPVIRLGLQTTRELEEPGAIVAGPFHPSFRSLVESSLFLEMASALIASSQSEKGAKVRAVAPLPSSPRSTKKIFTFTVSPSGLSNLTGPRRINITLIRERFGSIDIHVASDPSLQPLTLLLSDGDRRLRTDCAGRIEEIK